MHDILMVPSFILRLPVSIDSYVRLSNTMLLLSATLILTACSDNVLERKSEILRDLEFVKVALNVSSDAAVVKMEGASAISLRLNFFGAEGGRASDNFVSVVAAAGYVHPAKFGIRSDEILVFCHRDKSARTATLGKIGRAAGDVSVSLRISGKAHDKRQCDEASK